MKIIRIIARLNVGGPAKHVVWLTKGLQSAECETLLVAGSVPEGEDDMSYFAAEQSVSPLIVPSMSREISLKDALTVWKLYRLFVRERPDIVHTHTAKAGTVGRFAGFLYRWMTPASLLGRPRACRFVHTYHGHIFHSYYGALKTKIFLTVEKLLAWLVTDRIVVISEQQRHEIHEQFRVGRSSQFAVIPLGLDTHVFADWETKRERFREELQVRADEILVGIVGRLTEIKNHELFLRLAARYKAGHGSGKDSRKVRFVVIGDGHLRATLEQQAQTLGLEEDVVFTGSRQDPEYFYPALDIVALTSRNEGTPLTLIEAMLNARPIISTAVGGVVDLLGEIVEPETVAQPYAVCARGIRVRPDDAAAFAEGLARLVADAELRRTLGRQAAEFVARNYSKDRLLEDLSGLYHELLQTAEVTVSNGPVKRSLASRF